MVERKESQPCQAQGRDEQPRISPLHKNSRYIQDAQCQREHDYSPQWIIAQCEQVHEECNTGESDEDHHQQLHTSTKRQLSPIALALGGRDKYVIGQKMFEENPAQTSKVHGELSSWSCFAAV